MGQAQGGNGGVVSASVTFVVEFPTSVESSGCVVDEVSSVGVEVVVGAVVVVSSGVGYGQY